MQPFVEIDLLKETVEEIKDASAEFKQKIRELADRKREKYKRESAMVNLMDE